jgi:hypothetical protein
MKYVAEWGSVVCENRVRRWHTFASNPTVAEAIADDSAPSQCHVNMMAIAVAVAGSDRN